MVVPHLHFNGECLKAMKLYARAFGATINKIIFIEDEKPEKGILHAEMTIHGQRIMLNDNRSEICSADFPFAQLVVTFANDEELKKSYEILKNENGIVSSMKATDYTSCTVGFWDMFGICICQLKIRSKDHSILGHFFVNKCASENCTKAQ